MELVLAINQDLIRVGIEQCQLNPTVLNDIPDALTPGHDLPNSVRRRLDHNQQPYGLMNLNTLPGQTRPQVTRRTIHDTQQ